MPGAAAVATTVQQQHGDCCGAAGSQGPPGGALQRAGRGRTSLTPWTHWLHRAQLRCSALRAAGMERHYMCGGMAPSLCAGGSNLRSGRLPHCLAGQLERKPRVTCPRHTHANTRRSHGGKKGRPWSSSLRASNAACTLFLIKTARVIRGVEEKNRWLRAFRRPGRPGSQCIVQQRVACGHRGRRWCGLYCRRPQAAGVVEDCCQCVVGIDGGNDLGVTV